MTQTKQAKGFTLMELLVVMGIIAVLATLVIGAILTARNTAKETANRANAKAFQAGLESYYTRNRAYPVVAAANATFTDGTNDIDTLNTAAILGTTVNLDTTTGCANGGAYLYSSSAGGYDIRVLNSNCDAATGANDKFTN